MSAAHSGGSDDGVTERHDILFSLLGDDLTFDAATGAFCIVLRLVGEAVAKLYVTDAHDRICFSGLEPCGASGSFVSTQSCRSAIKGLFDRTEDGTTFDMQVFSVVEAAQEVLAAMKSATTSAPAATGHGNAAPPAPSSTSVLLLIDHMRSKRSYCGLIENWANTLSLSGRLVFLGDGPKPTILLHLRGSGDSVKEYLKLHRTTPVDVDSEGRKCKEKMMTALYEGVDSCDPVAGRAPSSMVASVGPASFEILDPSTAGETAKYLLDQGVPASCLRDIPALKSALLGMR